ncbi:hypothetical protein [Mucilaginibacter sp. NFR10]|nr:hypothetical protein [Mucilaginibacter sp. NFR10]
MLHKALALILTTWVVYWPIKSCDKAEAFCDGAGEPNNMSDWLN